MRALRARNVNEAVMHLHELYQERDMWRTISPRGLETREYLLPVATTYDVPTERVLFDPARDANPFFHLMEAIWILAGRQDVDFLARFNSNMRQFSDNGVTFHAAYGNRLRYWPRDEVNEMDQVGEVIRLLQRDPTSRQAVLAIWDPVRDLGAVKKDIPCNDLIMLKVRDGKLNMTVSCRSNDAIWGAYGANAVQFSMLQEFIAIAVGVEVGTYTQVSDSFHIYTNNEAWKAMHDSGPCKNDPYQMGVVKPFPLMSISWDTWRTQASAFCGDWIHSIPGLDPFFVHVAGPMRHAWEIYKNDKAVTNKNERIVMAKGYLFEYCKATDWAYAGTQWLGRRFV